jgi:hypothetical protein
MTSSVPVETPDDHDELPVQLRDLAPSALPHGAVDCEHTTDGLLVGVATEDIGRGAP